jgi:hypothetical protein
MKTKGDREYFCKRPKKKKKPRGFNNKENKELRGFIKAFKEKHPCKDCGEADIVTLEFDHVRGKKRDNVSNMVKYNAPIELIVTEIAKCDVVCANCHRKRTRDRKVNNV